MRYYIFIIVVFTTILFACQNKQKPENKTDYQTIKEEIKIAEKQPKIKRTDTLFLNLSPNMTKEEFKEAIDQENGKRLKKNKFSVFIDNQIIEFDIYNYNKSITLGYSQYFSQNDLDNNIHKRLFKNIFSIYDEKYKYHNYADFPLDLNYDSFTKTYYYHNSDNDNKQSQIKDLNQYGFPQTNYAVLNNSYKAIVIGYSIKKNKMLELLNSSPVPIRNGFDDKSNEPMQIREIKPNEIKKFKFILTINYFHLKDYDSIRNIVTTDYEKAINGFEKQLEENDKKIEKLKNNKSEL